MSVPTVPLDDVASIERQGVEPPEIASGTLYVGLDNIRSGGGFVGVSPINAGDVLSNKFAFSAQHVLFGKLRPYLAKVARPSFSGVCSTDILPILPGPTLDRGYLAQFLLTPGTIALATSRATGVNLPRLSPSVLGRFQIPLPPLSEQRRIADVLDRADALRARRRAALALLDTLNQSIFVEMFGDTVTNSKGWHDAMLLGDAAEIVSGVTKGRRVNGKRTRELPYLAVANVQDHALDLSAVKRIEATDEEVERYRLQVNDLVLTEGGDPDKLGRGCLWKGELTECIHQNHIFRVRLKTDVLEPLFLNWLVSSPRGKRYFLRSAKQTTGIASINMTQLKRFPLVVPPLNLQREFVRRIGIVEGLRNLAGNSLVALDGLFASLQHQAFRGELKLREPLI